jgi:type III secretion protein W
MAIDGTMRAEVQAFTAKQGVDAPIAESMRQEGLFEGQKVVQTDEAAKGADAAEEMTFAASEKVEKTLSERKAGSKEALKASAAELAQHYVNQMAEPQASRKLHEFLDALKKMGSEATEEDIRQAVGEHFKDSSDQYSALSFAEDALKKEGGNGQLLAKLGAVKAQLMKDAGPAIRSGLNIAADVLSYARQGLGNPAALRDLYRDSILGGQSIGSMYTAILKRYDESQFSQSLEFLLRAAGSDLDGKLMGSSMEAPQLKNAIDDIYHVQALGNTHRTLGDLLNKTRLLFPAAA